MQPSIHASRASVASASRDPRRQRASAKASSSGNSQKGRPAMRAHRSVCRASSSAARRAARASASGAPAADSSRAIRSNAHTDAYSARASSIQAWAAASSPPRVATAGRTPRSPSRRRRPLAKHSFHSFGTSTTPALPSQFRRSPTNGMPAWTWSPPPPS
ncbi:MAG TPA: hypothetical protein VFU21_19130 [Kofleriaceae bacterium]|nr:hypothetical protein [Kofleriaceae bacterium]